MVETAWNQYSPSIPGIAVAGIYSRQDGCKKESERKYRQSIRHGQCAARSNGSCIENIFQARRVGSLMNSREGPPQVTPKVELSETPTLRPPLPCTSFNVCVLVSLRVEASRFFSMYY